MHPEALTEESNELLLSLREFDGFYLAGGTGLALQIGHRVSEDFDFFTEDYLPENFLGSVEGVFSDRAITPSVNNSEELTVFINNTKVTFLRYPFPLVSELLEYRGISLIHLEEIAATKAYTIGRRGSFKDYVDLYFCLKGEYVSIDEIMEMAREKYEKRFNSRLFLEQLVYLDDIEETAIQFIQPKVGKKELSSFFKKEIAKIDL